MQVPPLRDARPKDVIQWLASNRESWLLILDNCDDAEIDFVRYIPLRGGSVIITSRLSGCRIHGVWECLDNHLTLNTSHLAKEDEPRPRSSSTRFRNSEKLNEAVSLLDRRMDHGKETLQGDPEELRVTPERLANAQEKLRQTSRTESLVNFQGKQNISYDTSDSLANYRAYQHIQGLTKRAALMF
jgi:hypothetical protein